MMTHPRENKIHMPSTYVMATNYVLWSDLVVAKEGQDGGGDEEGICVSFFFDFAPIKKKKSYI